MGRRAVTPRKRREAQFGEAAATGRLGFHPLARRQRQRSEEEFPRAGCGVQRRQGLGEDVAGFAVEPQHDGSAGRAGLAGLGLRQRMVDNHRPRKTAALRLDHLLLSSASARQAFACSALTLNSSASVSGVALSGASGILEALTEEGRRA